MRRLDCSFLIKSGEKVLSSYPPCSWPFCDHHSRNSSARPEITFHFRPRGPRPAHHIFEYLIDDIFLKDSEIAIRLQIFFQRLQFKASLRRHVADGEHSEIGQSGFRADRSKLWVIDDNFISRKLVWPSFNLRKIGI